LEQFSEDGFVVASPGFLEALEETADRGSTREGSGLYPGRRGSHLGVRCVQVDEGVEVAALRHDGYGSRSRQRTRD
jgi:hypothetical protein